MSKFMLREYEFGESYLKVFWKQRHHEAIRKDIRKMLKSMKYIRDALEGKDNVQETS